MLSQAAGTDSESLQQQPFHFNFHYNNIHQSFTSPETESDKKGHRSLSGSAGRADICLFSAKFLTTHSGPGKHIWEIGKVTKIKMCPDVNFPLCAVTGPGHQSNVQLSLSS